MFLSHFTNTQYKKLNEGKDNEGVFFTPNGHNGRRLKENLTHVNAVFADWDFKPKEDEKGNPIEPTGARKPDYKQFMLDLDDLPTPTFVVESGNGWHLYWCLEDSIEVDDDNREEMITQVEGIHRFIHQQFGSDAGAGDVLRLMRVPGHEHKKQPEHPFMVEIVEDNSDTTYTLDELLEAMPPVYRVEVPQGRSTGDSELNIREVAIDAWAERGCEASFDNLGHLIIDGAPTATFEGREDGGGYMATTSTEYPFRGNATTYTAGVLGISTKDAYKRLVDKYGEKAKIKERTRGNTGEVEAEDPYPERTKYLAHMETEPEEDKFKQWDDKRKVLEAMYMVNFYKFFAAKYPNLLFEIGEDKSYFNYNEAEGIYECVNFSTVRGNVIKLLVDDGVVTKATEATAKNILNKYRGVLTERGVTLDSFTSSDNVLHVKNGWLDLKSLELQPHSRDRLSLFKMGVDYNAEETCPLYDKALDVDFQMPQDQIRVIDQYSGYVLTNGIEQQQCLIFEGTPGCGKSMLPEIWLEVLGTKGTTASLKSLGGSEIRFMGDMFAHKNLCFFDEANPSTPNITEYFQNLVTKPQISVERKGIQQRVDVRNSLKIVLALNEMPDHMPPGMDRRMRHLLFTRSFYDDGTVDKDYKKKVIAAELSGILNRMLKGLHDYWKMGGLTSIAGEEDRKKQYVLAADDFSAFISDNFLPVPKSDHTVRYSPKEFQGSFLNEFSKPYHKQLSSRGFNKKLFALRLPEFKHIQFNKSNGKWGYQGIILKPDREFVSDGFGSHKIRIHGESDDEDYKIDAKKW